MYRCGVGDGIFHQLCLVLTRTAQLIAILLRALRTFSYRFTSIIVVVDTWQAISKRRDCRTSSLMILSFTFRPSRRRKGGTVESNSTSLKEYHPHPPELLRNKYSQQQHSRNTKTLNYQAFKQAIKDNIRAFARKTAGSCVLSLISSSFLGSSH